jgi:Asp-tRNA(Asn)/Glu-tRNA(Gln) amidotransferase A subunit family amidase
MTLSWTMDKLGPICRSAEDCAAVLSAIHGPDGLDRTVQEVPFAWDGDRGLEGIRVGYLERAFRPRSPSQVMDLAALATLEALGVELHPVDFPGGFPLEALRLIVSVEAAASFDELTRGGRDALMGAQEALDWPNTFRVARLVPAVEYLQANRVRAMLMQALDEAWRDVDVVVTPTFADGIVLATNLTGHPVVVTPSGFLPDHTPSSISFLGGLWKDAAALHVAKAFQEATGHHLRRPPSFS